VGELGPGHPGPDHDDALRQLAHRIELRPGEDPFSVRAGRARLARGRPGGDQHYVGCQLLRAAPLEVDPHLPRPEQGADPTAYPHAVGLQEGQDVPALGPGQGEDPLVHRREVGARRAGGVALRGGLAVQLDPEHPRRPEGGHELRGGYQRLARDAVGQHAGTAEAVAVDHRDGGPEPRRDDGRLVAPGSTTEDDDGGGAIDHEDIQPPGMPWAALPRNSPARG